MSDAKIGSFNVNEESARGAGHPPVIRTIIVAPNQGVLPAGLLVADSASGLAPWASATAETAPLVGVLDLACDTASQDSALAIVHGSVRLSVLKVGATDSVAPDETALAALLAAGLYTE